MRKSTLLLLVLALSLAVFTVAEEATTTNPETTTTTETTATETKTEAPAAEGPDSDGFSAAEASSLAQNSEAHEFQAEVSRLMDIIINSLYSNREVFLREIISNASDALDKIRYLSLTDKNQLGEGDVANLDIRIKADKTARTLTIQDKGIGMTKKDLIHSLGTVASSGTSKFVEAASKGASDALSLIGQFGVGFYSVYLVAERVTVITKHNDEKQYVWTSNANRTFSIAEDPRGNTLGRGTQIILHLKDDSTEFLDQHTLENLIAKYSEFINFPILLETSKNVEKQVPEEEEAKTEEKKESTDDVEVSDEEEKKEEKKTKTVIEEVHEWKQVNENKAIWTRDAKDVTEKEYEDFYKAISKDHSGALTYTHFKAEGEIAFKSILFIPQTAPHDLYDKYYSKSQALKLYVRRVLISDEFEDFLPRYLNFIKGVVDSDDLPLNVSRETLSKNKILKVIGKKLTRKVIEMLRKLSDDATKYEEKKEEEEKKKKDETKELTEEEKKEEEEEKAKTEELKKNAEKWDSFWKQYSKSIKLGVIEDTSNKNKLMGLLRFITSKSDKPIPLQTYVDRMKDKQHSIYYITGESLAVVKKSPFLETLTKRGYEVVLMVDALDEYLMANMPEFAGKKFSSITKEGFHIEAESDDEKAREKAMQKYYESLTAWLKNVYADKVEKVVISNRISDSPAVLVTGQYGWSANMERIMKAQTLSNSEQQAFMISKKTMEINPRHPLIKELKIRSESHPEDEKLRDLANLVYDSALISSGFALDDVTNVSQRINRVVANGLGVATDASPLSDSDFPALETESDEDSGSETKAESHDEL